MDSSTNSNRQYKGYINSKKNSLSLNPGEQDTVNDTMHFSKDKMAAFPQSKLNYTVIKVNLFEVILYGLEMVFPK